MKNDVITVHWAAPPSPLMSAQWPGSYFWTHQYPLLCPVEPGVDPGGSPLPERETDTMQVNTTR